MKKVLLSAVAILGFTFANAQEETTTSNGGFSKGDLFISGAFGIGSESTGDDKSTGFEIAPRVGFFLTENIAIGGKIGYASDKAEDAFGDTQDDVTLTLGAFGRYYFTPASQFSLFGEFGFDYMTEEDKLSDSKSNGFGVGLGLGLSYFVSNNWAIEATWAGLRYETTKPDFTGAESTDTFGLGADLRSFGFGVIYKF